jgi:hypothetical protein
MVRIRDEDHEMAKELAEGAGMSISEVVSRALEEYRRKHFLYGLAEDFAALRVRDRDWEDEIEERRAWDGVLGDDIESE